MGFTKNEPSCLHQDIRTLGEAPALGNSLFSDALPHLGDVNVNMGGLVSVRGLRQGIPGLSLAGYRDIEGGSGFR